MSKRVYVIQLIHISWLTHLLNLVQSHICLYSISYLKLGQIVLLHHKVEKEWQVFDLLRFFHPSLPTMQIGRLNRKMFIAPSSLHNIFKNNLDVNSIKL